MSNILSIDSVSKHYGNFTALNNVSLNIREGSIFGLLGPNGAGKTTLIRIINQITMPDSGKVLFDNTPLNVKHIKDIGYLPEERGLYQKMSIGDQALYLAQLKGLDNSTSCTSCTGAKGGQLEATFTIVLASQATAARVLDIVRGVKTFRLSST